ncbi:MAG: hypothetical protein KME01_13835 [Chroococcus sp. CMT-3BRIN-NPC107]|jgi:hypothetical protein|nr:hypothetical protein [Chroococcus sp. CMT-3BRIN-NPC107]
MAPNPAIMEAVEQLGYRVTVGDVATQAGFNVNLAEQGLLALATDVGGHLQVAESGEIVYLFPKNLRAILRNKFLRLRLQEWWKKVWRVLFYLIRISFGVLLLASIVLIVVTIFVILTAMNQSSDNDNSDRGYGGNSFFMPYFWIGPNWYGVFSPDYDRRYQERRTEESQLNFFEAIFSFLFGDCNPNADLEERRQKEIAAVIRSNRGAVVGEQIAPYLDDVGSSYAQEYEDYMLPVLTSFNGQPTVSLEGHIVYVFPQLQSYASRQQQLVPVPPYLQELPQRFSAASSGQLGLSIGLGVLNLGGALFLGNLLSEVAAGGLVGFVQAIYWLLLGYGVAFLGVPLVRYFWLKWRNTKIRLRNSQRQERSLQLADSAVEQKIAYARQFAAQNVITNEDLVYTSETDLLDQEVENSDSIDAEWQRRLRESR